MANQFPQALLTQLALSRLRLCPAFPGTGAVGTNVKTFADGSQEVTEGDMVDRSRLMVDTSKWFVRSFATNTRERERQADFLAAQVVEIADTVREGKKVRVSAKGGITEEHGDHVDRSRLMVDARKWLASKLAPRKYGEKIDATVSGPDGGPVQQHPTVEFINVLVLWTATNDLALNVSNVVPEVYGNMVAMARPRTPRWKQVRDV